MVLALRPQRDDAVVAARVAGAGLAGQAVRGEDADEVGEGGFEGASGGGGRPGVAGRGFVVVV